MFKGKVVLILGGTGSIGSAIASAFKKEGAKVLKHSFRSGKYKADLKNSVQTKKLIKKVIKDVGKINILVNSISAPAKIGNFEKKSWKDFEKHLSLQLKSAVETTTLTLPYMKKEGGGKIINILTSYTLENVPASLSDYVTAKYAMLGLTKSLAKDLAKYNITVNAVSPRFIFNKFNKGVPAKLVDIIKSQTPKGRLTKERDVAKKVLFLSSKKSDRTTGKNIIV